MKIEIEPYSCVSSGNCIIAAPLVFDQDPEDGRVRLKTDEPPEDQRANVDKAIFLCPAQAIEWAEED
ncbi:ferredoxin [Paeniglutamicibacter antarcticus]|uniref:Ferredoxin n=1 Tax=Arthrobacter terrae TaxID=2935737 RepID=A0A931CS57_9MICC|nr:ferredoxin [Arthrobacter terrae]MBG0739929.1 ferredoxin [Arthrobacter terrae]